MFKSIIMRKVVLIFALLTAFGGYVISQPQLTWQFANFEVINAGTQLQFDVQVKANVATTYHRDLQVYIDYNTAGFGSDVVANANVSFTPLELLDNHYVLVNPAGADNTSSKFAVITEAIEEMDEAGSATYFNLMPSTFAGLLRITMDIIDNTQPAGISFDATLMDGGQYYQSTSNTDPIKYMEAGVYANDLLSDLLSTAYGKITYANVANTVLNGAVATLKMGAVTVDVSVADAFGDYYFSGIADGAYTITTTCAKPWGGVTAADALLVKRFAAGVIPLNALQQIAADVNLASGVSAADAILVKRRAAGIISSWAAPDFVFTIPTVNVTSGIGTANYQGLCSGDINGSYTPPVN